VRERERESERERERESEREREREREGERERERVRERVRESEQCKLETRPGETPRSRSLMYLKKALKGGVAPPAMSTHPFPV